MSSERAALCLAMCIAVAACVEVEEEEKGRPLEPPRLMIHNSSQFALRELRVHPDLDYRKSRNILNGDLEEHGKFELTWDKTQYVTVLREKVRHGKVLAFTTATPIGGMKPGNISELIVFDESFRLASVYVPPAIPIALTAGGYHACAADRDGNAKCWGAGYAWRPRPDRPGDPFSPRWAGYSGIVALAAGDDFTCGLKTDRSLRCWGVTTQTTNRGKTTTFKDWETGITDVQEAVSIAAGGQHACSLSADGTVRCWGSNFTGQLGDGTTTDRRFDAGPAPVLADAVAVSAGAYHACALRRDGHVSCWGLNDYGQLGDGTTESRLTPVEVLDLPDSTGVSAGAFHTCAIVAGGSVRCWGDYTHGQLGNGSQKAPTACAGQDNCGMTPVAVPGLTGIQSISTGSDYTCAIRSDGTVACWGWNGFGQLGNGRKKEIEGVVPISGLSNVVAVSAGVAHACARVERGTVHCWGLNNFGQLGSGTERACGKNPCDSSTPIEVPGLP